MVSWYSVLVMMLRQCFIVNGHGMILGKEIFSEMWLSNHRAIKAHVVCFWVSNSISVNLKPPFFLEKKKWLVIIIAYFRNIWLACTLLWLSQSHLVPRFQNSITLVCLLPFTHLLMFKHVILACVNCQVFNAICLPIIILIRVLWNSKDL